MITALMFAGLLSVQSREAFWVVTESNPREVVAVDVGFAFVPEGKDYLLTLVSTVHRVATPATRWAAPAYTSEQVAFRCEDRTYLVRHSTISSGAHDPIRTSYPEGPFVSVASDPQRRKQAEAVCQPRTDQTLGSERLVDLWAAHGIHTGGPAVMPRLAGPQPYPVAASERDRPAREPERPYPPRIGVDASYAHNPGGGLVIGYAVHRGGRWVTEFYSMGALAANPAAEPVIFVRRALDSWEAQEQIQWVDSRTCRGIVAALAPANDLGLPVVILPVDEASRLRVRNARPPAPPATGGPGLNIFWAPARGPISLDIQFSSYGGPWVDWARSVDRVLEPCWQNDRPVRPADPD